MKSCFDSFFAAALVVDLLLLAFVKINLNADHGVNVCVSVCAYMIEQITLYSEISM